MLDARERRETTEQQQQIEAKNRSRAYANQEPSTVARTVHQCKTKFIR